MDEEYIVCKSMKEFKEFCKDGDWEDEYGFFQATGIYGIELLGKPFTVVHNRVYLKEDC